jgi:molecular chaperone DnaK
MSDDEINKAVREAAEYEAQDKKRKEGIEARNDADSMVFQVQNALNEVGDKINPDDKAKVQAEIDSLKDVLSRTEGQDDIIDADLDAIKAGKERLMNAAQPVFTKMYENQAPGAGQQGGFQQGGYEQAASGPDDDVVDADYTEV